MIRTNTSAGTIVSGGGADGHVDRVLTLCLARVVVNRTGPVSSQPVDPSDKRRFDIAELIAWACQAAGVTGVLPQQADELLLYCRTNRTLISVEDALALKGALLFGQGATALSLGSRGRAIVYSSRSGVAVDSGTRTWTIGARIPGARGYR